MSLLKWQEMAKSKSALGKKINFVHNAITQKKLGDETSQIGFEKMFKSVTSKLDDVVASNLPRLQKQPARRKKANLEGIDYFPDVDPFEDMDVEGLFDDAPVSPQAEKQIRPYPPTYEEIVKEVGKDPPAYEEMGGDPPEYEEDDPPAYAEKPGDEAKEEANQILTDLDLTNYDDLEKTLNEPDISSARKAQYLKNLLTIATMKTNQLKGFKASFTKKWKRGEITEEAKQWQHRRADRGFQTLKEYKNYLNKQKMMLKGSGIKKRKKGGGAVRFFSDPKELFQKLEVIVGSILAGNTNVSIRNTGVGILDLLLKEGAINRSQHEKLFRKYFKP